MARPARESREWYSETIRKFATKDNWTEIDKLEYCYQVLLNFKERYDTKANGRDRDWLIAWAEWIKQSCLRAIVAHQRGNFEGLYWNIMLLMSRHRVIDAYLQFLERNREQHAKYYEPRREILMKHGVIQSFQDLIDDKLDLLAVSMPPGTGKTTLEIFVLSGVIGWFPDMPNLSSSFSGTMTKSIYDGVTQILNDPDEYSWHEIFPDVEYDQRKGTNSKDQTINVGSPKRFKSLTCRAINASLTGNTRCEYLLCADDMCSGIEEALNKDRLEKLWTTYNTDLKTRKKQGCKELHIATRWSTMDLIGRLKAQNEDNPRARFIAIPALDENGESNFNYRGGVGFDKKYFEDMKRSMDDISFKCLFMNEPIEREGLLYHDDEIRRYLTLPVEPPDAILSIADTKNKGTDFFAQPVFLQYGDDYYCVDTIYDDDSDYERQYAKSANMIINHKVEACQFESNNGGDRVSLEVSKRVKDAKGYCNITQQYTTQNKETKIIVYAPWVKEHVIFRDRSLYQPNDEYGRFMAAVLGYSPVGKNKHDDAPDVLSSFAKWKNKPESQPAIVGRRFF